MIDRIAHSAWRPGARGPSPARRGPSPATLLAWACVSVTACSDAGATPDEGAPRDLPRHEIVFSRHADDARTDYDIWRMCSDGTQMASLVVAPGHQFQASVSPDGTRLAYAADSEGQRDVWIRPMGRGEPINLSDHPSQDSGPAWSPDGRGVAFFSDRDVDAGQELYFHALDTGALTRLTADAYYDSGADWGPDGSWIAFTRFYPAESEGGQGAGEVVSLDLATGTITDVTSMAGGYNGGVDVSPDGSQIAFHRTSDTGSELWVVDADGSNPRALTDTFVDEYDPEWSPDGEWLLFSAGTQSDGAGTFDLWLMRVDGSQRHVLNRGANTEAWQTWRTGEHFCR